ncbi:MAG: PKD domain-containing protein [Bacteroidia bacterium]|nr:PKD domain-containing protein [Bacteroidia bacterium]
MGINGFVRLRPDFSVIRGANLGARQVGKLADDGQEGCYFQLHPTGSGQPTGVGRVDSLGQILWSADLSTTGLADALEANSQGMLVASRGKLLQIDPLGNLLWSHDYSYMGYPLNLTRIKKHPTNGCWVMGSAYAKGLIMRLDSLGDTLWTGLYETGNTEFVFMDLVQESNGNLVVIGDWGVYFSLLRLDSLGVPLLAKTYGHYDGITSADIFPNQDGSFHIPVTSVFVLSTENYTNVLLSVRHDLGLNWMAALSDGAELSVIQLPDSNFLAATNYNDHKVYGFGRSGLSACHSSPFIYTGPVTTLPNLSRGLVVSSGPVLVNTALVATNRIYHEVLVCECTDSTLAGDPGFMHYFSGDTLLLQDTSTLGVISSYQINGVHVPATGQWTSYLTPGPGVYQICGAISGNCVKPFACVLDTQFCSSAIGFNFSTTLLDATFQNFSDPGTYYWDFGDGNSSSANSPTHTYASPGTYSVTLTLTDSCGVFTKSQLVTVTNCLPLMADFSYVASGDTVAFTDASAGNIVAWNWNFDTLGSSSAQNPTLVFPHGGPFPVTLTVIDTCGQTASLTYMVNLPCPTLGPGISYTYNGWTYSFSWNGTGEPASYFWWFGDLNHSYLPAPTHTYASPGMYHVSLTLSDYCGNSLIEDVYLPPCPSLSAGFSYQINQNQVTFVDTSLGAISAWHWDFGNGNTSNLQFPPAQNFPFNSNQQATLIVTDSCGNLDTVVVGFFIPVGLEEDLEKQFVTLYPNPGNGMYILKFSEGYFANKWTLMDQMGRIVQTGELDKGLTKSLDFCHISGGIYTLQVSGGGQLANFKLIHQP